MRRVADSQVMDYDAQELLNEVRPINRVLRGSHGRVHRHQFSVSFRTIPQGRPPGSGNEMKRPTFI